MHTRKDLAKYLPSFTKEEKKSGHVKEIDPANLKPHKQVILRKRGEVKIGRNDPCPCGSGKKYKRCCQGKKFPPPEAP